MATDTNIEWADHTFNGWWGCSKVHRGCAHCYAEGEDKRRTRRGTKRHWGVKHPRRFIRGVWSDVAKWQREAAEAGVVRLVFCGSMKDIFEDHSPEAGVVDQLGKPLAIDAHGDFKIVPQWPSAEERARLGCPVWRALAIDDLREYIFERLIPATPNLLWLLLTKRPENIRRMVPAAWLEPGGWPVNVMTGTSPCDQETANELIPHLLQVPGPHFLSIEPMVGPIDLRRWMATDRWYMTRCERCGWIGSSEFCGEDRTHDDADVICPGCMASVGHLSPAGEIAWVIVGGESGSKNTIAPMHPKWPRDLRDQCSEAGVPFFFKQWGEWLPISETQCDDGSLYASNRVAEDPEDQVSIDDVWGKHCIVPNTAIKYDGSINGDYRLSPEGVPDYLTFRVGKKDAGRLLEGKLHSELPATQIEAVRAAAEGVADAV